MGQPVSELEQFAASSQRVELYGPEYLVSE
jgi:hypothetical protein